MIIERIHIENFRGFEKISLSFESNLTVLIGINGSGKSSVLDCIAILLSVFVDRLTGSRSKIDSNLDIRFSRNDVSVGASAAKVSIEILANDKDRLEWNISRSQLRSRSSTKFSGKGLSNYIRKALLQTQRTNSVSGLSLLVYYKTNRMVIDSSSDFRLKEEQLELFSSEEESFQGAYENAFTARIKNFHDFFHWFKNEEDVENEIRLREKPDYRNPNLEVVRKAIKDFLNGFPNSHFSDLRVVRTEVPGQYRNIRAYAERSPSLTINKDGKEINLEKLSDGEQMLLMLVVDIARRLAILNANSKDIDKILSSKGIVLIDEVDLHLHPGWQRLVVPSLIKTFPGCQFIVTTHSPQVLSNIKKENILILEDSQVWNADSRTYGRDSNSILTELMDVSERPVEMKEELEKCFQLIDQGEIQKAKLKLRDLSTLLGSQDVEVVRAHTLIDFLDRIED